MGVTLRTKVYARRGEEDINFIDMLFVERREAEREVNEYLKKMEL